MFSVNHLRVAAGGRTLIADLTLSWSLGTFVAILGPNGAGKTTFLNLLAGISLDAPLCVFLGQQDLMGMPPLERASQISSIAQYDEADPETRVEDRIGHGLYARKKSLGLTTSEERELIKRIACKLGIENLLSRPLFTLSGGQRKKVHIARALVDDRAQVYILDEPDASLDANSRDDLMGVLKEICANEKIVIASLHHHELADLYCDEKKIIEPIGPLSHYC